MSRTIRRTADEYNREPRTRKPTKADKALAKRLTRKQATEALIVDATDIARIAAFPISDYPAGNQPVLLEPGGRIMALPRSTYDYGTVSDWN